MDILISPIPFIWNGKKISNIHCFPVLWPAVDHALILAKWGIFLLIKKYKLCDWSTVFKVKTKYLNGSLLVVVLACCCTSVYCIYCLLLARLACVVKMLFFLCLFCIFMYCFGLFLFVLLAFGLFAFVWFGSFCLLLCFFLV